jgi:hypothetical protein
MRTTRRRCFRAAAFAAALIMFGDRMVTAASVRTVALSGQLAPGTASGVHYASFMDFPVLNAAGQTAFRAYLTGSGVDHTNDQGIWSEGSGALALVARSGGEAPGTASGVKYNTFSLSRFSHTLNSAGQTAFRAGLTGNGVHGLNDEGIWSEGSGTLALVARDGGLAPGTASGVRFSGFGFSDPRLNDAGQTAFDSTLTGSGVDSTNDEGLWTEGSGPLALIAREGSQAPGTASGVRYGGTLGGFVFSTAGQAAFRASLTGNGVNSTNNQGIWSAGSGTLALVARTGSQAPGTANGVNYSQLFIPVLNAAGQAAFLAVLTGSGVNSNNHLGIWLESSGTRTLVVRSGRQAPGANGTNYSNFGTPVLNAAGRMAFHATLTGSGVDVTNNQGIWSEGSGALALVARTGSQAPGTASGVNYSFLGSPSLNARGQTVFFAELTGSGVDDSNDYGIWATDTNGLVHLIVRVGDPLEITPGDVRTVSAIGFIFSGGTGNEDGRRSGFNDLGQFAFAASFVDGSQGIFVSNQVAVPEPSSMTLAAISIAAALVACRPRT